MLKRLLTAVLALCLMASMAVISVGAEDYATFTLELMDDGSGTATLTVTVPAGSASGKIVVSVSDDLTLIENSAVSDIAIATINEGYDVADVFGVCLAFASSETYAEETLALTVKYTVKDGASLTTDDFRADVWTLTDGIDYIGRDKEGDVIKKIEDAVTITFAAGNGGSVKGETSIKVAKGTSLADVSFPELQCDTDYIFKAWDKTEGTVDGNITITASFLRLGDVNLDGRVTSLDAAQILRHDAGLIKLEGDSLLAANVNDDGKVNSLDAAQVLRLDAGLIKNFSQN